MPPAAAATPLRPAPRPEVRRAVQELLEKSEAFAAMPPEKRREIAQNTARVADYLAAPEGFEGNRLAAAQTRDEADYQTARQAVQEIGSQPWRAAAAREGAEAMSLMRSAIDFPNFVGGLIQGVFAAIVKSSIEQMEAYSKMIAEVAKSLDQFMQDNISPNQGRDHMVDLFPDIFEIGTDEFSDSGGPRLRLRDGVDESAALKRVNNAVSFEGGELRTLDLSDENVELAIVTGARMQLARQRQQLMASLVLMGINRIVVTDGRISAKMLIDVKAQDSRKLTRSATAFDYARDAQGNLQTTHAGEGSYHTGSKTSGASSSGWFHRTTGDNYAHEAYARGSYKYESRPVMTAMSAAAEASDAQLSTRAQLAGTVEVNFKSDFLPLEKMATPGMIAAIQGNSAPVDPNVLPSPRAAPAAPGQPAPSPAPGA